ncbi:MAG: hypothetical protein QOE83_105 [Actinomycetota bacterium]|jgi:hypothetical protein|nr:hypothetical protein [Actinomycetota bacterium]
MRVRCVALQGEGGQTVMGSSGLAIGDEYVVLEVTVSAADVNNPITYRISRDHKDESPGIWPASLFEVSDPTIPEDWILEPSPADPDRSQRHSSKFSGDFWLRYFDGDEQARSTYRTVVGTEPVTLFRPVGQAELDLIEESDYKRFPPRLPHQPIFYPVATESYAVQIARDWNTKDAASGRVGYVTRFNVKGSFLSNYQVQVVGGSEHREYWIPAEELAEFNDHIVGTIEVIHEFHGDS